MAKNISILVKRGAALSPTHLIQGADVELPKNGLGDFTLPIGQPTNDSGGKATLVTLSGYGVIPGTDGDIIALEVVDGKYAPWLLRVADDPSARAIYVLTYADDDYELVKAVVVARSLTYADRMVRNWIEENGIDAAEDAGDEFRLKEHAQTPLANNSCNEVVVSVTEIS